MTIPKELRARFGLGPGSDVEFVVSSGEIVMRKIERDAAPGGRSVARIRGRGDVELSTDELMALTRDPD